MALIEETLDKGVIDKVQIAINRYKAFEPPEGYYLAFSGGKDSVVIKALADMAGVKYDAHYNVTSVDPPELVQFIKEKYPDVSRDIPRDKEGKAITMWNLIPKKKMPPTRLARYCCAVLKESAGKGRITVTGVRWAESVRRKENQGLITVPQGIKGVEKTAKGGVVLNDDNDENRRMVEQCYRTRKTLLNPIVDWADEDVWEFIRKYNVPYCELYDKGFTRLGCIGCPMNSKAAAELDRYPKYKRAYIRTFDKMLDELKKAGLVSNADWKNGQDVMDWWVGKKAPTKEIENQISFFEKEIVGEILNGGEE